MRSLSNLNCLNNLDMAVVWTILNKLWIGLKGPLNLFFIMFFLTNEEQGIWYTFLNLSAMTVFADLGFTAVISQFVSFEFAKCIEKNGFISGEKYYVERLISLIRVAIRIYLAIIPIALIILIFVGYKFFGYSNIFLAWVVYSLVSALNLFISLLQYIYQGCEKIEFVQKNMLYGQIIMSVVGWALLFSQIGIWAFIIANLISVILMLFLFYKNTQKFWSQVLRFKNEKKYKWLKEIANLQWKYAISWASGFFIFNLYVPSVYKIEGATTAGQLGITLSALAIIMSLSAAWLDANSPRFSILAAQGRCNELWLLFKKIFLKCTVVYIIGITAGVLLITLINNYSIFENRFLSLNLCILLALSQFATFLITSMARYPRAFKTEPYYYMSVLNSILVAGLVCYILPIHKMEGLLIGVNMINFFVIIPISIYILHKFRQSNNFN